MKKTQEKYQTLLDSMLPGKWYKALEFEGVLNVGETRLKEIFRDMTMRGLLESSGGTKGRVYRKAEKSKC